MLEINWRGLYSGSLKGIISDASFAHPAKFSYKLICRIYEHGLEQGYWKAGDLIADPFAGCSIGGIVAAANGLRWIGVELEEKFVQLSQDNFELHRKQWERMGKPMPVCIQGDSRNFSSIIREAVDSIVTSPPYAEGGRHPSLGSVNKDDWGKEGKDIVARRGLDANYGAAEGQIGAMKEGKLDEVVAGIVTSPPWQQTGVSDHQGQTDTLKGGKFQGGGDAFLDADYGQSEGQLGGMPEGDHTEVVDSIITSPPYAESLQPETEEQTRRKQERIAKAKTIHNGRALEKPSPGKAALGGGYGASEGQLGAMKEGDFEEVRAVITSPPYAIDPKNICHTQEGKTLQDYDEARGYKAQARGRTGYSDDPDNLGNLPEGDYEAAVQGIVTSPPYARDTEPHGDIHHREGSELPRRAYGQAAGQLGTMSEGNHEAVVNGIVTSPPYEHGGPAQGTNGRSPEVVERTRQNIDGGTAFLEAHYGHSEGQIGNRQGDTYWAAVAQVYSECFKTLRQNGIMVVVVKDFVRQKKRVPLCDQTFELLQAIGFKPLERIKAWLVSEAEQKSLMPEIVGPYRKARKSFFRRLAERKGSPEINWEEVLILQRPNDNPSHNSLAPQQKTRA